MVGPARRKEIKRIDNKSSRQTSFSKRRDGLFKKARKLSSMTETEVAVIVFSETARKYDYSFNSMGRTVPTELTLCRYHQLKNGLPIENGQQPAVTTSETNSSDTNSLKLQLSRMQGMELDGLKLEELDELEQQISGGLLSIKKKKDEKEIEKTQFRELAAMETSTSSTVHHNLANDPANIPFFKFL